jgi:hypothetical protein
VGLPHQAFGDLAGLSAGFALMRQPATPNILGVADIPVAATPNFSQVRFTQIRPWICRGRHFRLLGHHYLTYLAVISSYYTGQDCLIGLPKKLAVPACFVSTCLLADIGRSHRGLPEESGGSDGCWLVARPVARGRRCDRLDARRAVSP